ncbi:hypothetical protein E5F05_13195 [Deinococcus metallilatus]|uniref:Tetratricopeptide (TPR) repeat protein n=1 Tax=Deinococcus metallilatus TaxID=1211322 RepID=A0AAJ5F4Y8_9DEIO|nr:hypothetical protein [Deinococcus metallilatus]MBB5294017.1 tetratricopeptide (TPR) repeat protein [Deinococcus metallilatus]QBY08809.1 hypothetical protein E5F05_13195 [Deinococcus metallilatus]RXJ09953.1 hypothetical protein ERJ73_12025 [Deinococcus metallilatus]TLK28110.1 hypothetical protein FCS05_09355 [Deinococcus metallilatus]GMA16650.1 hypothetical protein GCM10025871_29810 [Deinococcus metallilatus]
MLGDVWQAIDEGRYADARARLEADPALLASDPGQMALGYALAHDRRFDEAREVYGRLRAAHAGQPWEHVPLHQLGTVERLAGNPGAALRLFEEERALIERLPEDERAFKRAVNGYEVGVNRLALGEAEEARAALTAALADAQAADDPMTLGCVHRALGNLAARAGDRDTALTEYRQAQAAFQEADDERAAAETQALGDAL